MPDVREVPVVLFDGELADTSSGVEVNPEYSASQVTVSLLPKPVAVHDAVVSLPAAIL